MQSNLPGCIGVVILCGLIFLAIGLLSGLIMMAVAFYRVWLTPEDYVRSLEQNAAKYGYDRVFGRRYYRKWTQRVMVSFAFLSALLLVSIILWFFIAMMSH